MVSKVREAEVSDVKELSVLATKLMERHVLLDPEYYAIAENAAALWIPFVEGLIESDSGKVFLLEDGGLKGYTLNVFQERPPIYANRRVLYLGDVYVEPSHRGVPAMRLMSHTITWAREQDVNFIEYQYDPRNDFVNEMFSRVTNSRPIITREAFTP